MQRKLKIVSFAFITLALLCMPVFSHAASEVSIYENDISAETIPENPEPYADVSVRLTSYATDLNKATIQWRSGSSVVQSGIGKTTYSFKAPAANTSVVFDITITPEGSGAIVKRVIVTPSEVDILWEALDGYTPPFYKGKSFISAEGQIKAVAFPQTKNGTKNVTYNWKTGGTSVLSASGYSKDSYVFKNSELNDSENVSVVASSVDGSYNAAKSIIIPIVSPKVLFYKKSSTEGILYNLALANNTFILEDEATIVAEPYFLALKGNEEDFTYNWKINGTSIATPSRRTELTFRPTSRGGFATINVLFENLNTFYQKVSADLKLSL